MLDKPVSADDSVICGLVTKIAQALVDEEASVAVGLVDDPAITTLRLHVATSDIGKVIGKQGRTARSIRTIISAAAMKLNKRYALDIEEE